MPPSPVSLLFRTDDPSRWGTGIGVDLTAPQIDQNFYALQSAINSLISDPSSPVNIVSITSNGNQLTFNMSDGSTVGPVYLPVLQFNWRGDWEPETQYLQLDVFQVPSVGLFAVLVNHVSADTFDPAYQVDSQAAYLTMFEFAPPVNLIYDVGFYYAGLLSSIDSGIIYIYQEPMVRKVLLPATPFAGSEHQAYLETAPTTEDQTIGIFWDDTLIGNILFSIGENQGTVSITADQPINMGERLSVGKPSAADATAAGLSVVFAAQQVVS